MSIVGDGLKYNIEKENEANEGNVWSDRKVRLNNWIKQKNIVIHSNKCEEQFTKFEAHVGMPAQETPC